VKAQKFRNQPVEIDGKRFHSKKEGKRYLELKLLQQAGEISHLETQPRFKLVVNGAPLKYESGRTAFYVGDFAYFCAAREKRIVEDVKSPATKTPLYKLKKALVEHIYPAVKIVEV
jgi:hypothetical protein